MKSKIVFDLAMSIVNELVAKGFLTVEEYKEIEQKNMISFL